MSTNVFLILEKAFPRGNHLLYLTQTFQTLSIQIQMIILQAVGLRKMGDPEASP